MDRERDGKKIVTDALGYQVNEEGMEKPNRTQQLRNHEETVRIRSISSARYPDRAIKPKLTPKQDAETALASICRSSAPVDRNGMETSQGFPRHLGPSDNNITASLLGRVHDWCLVS